MIPWSRVVKGSQALSLSSCSEQHCEGRQRRVGRTDPDWQPRKGGEGEVPSPSCSAGMLQEATVASPQDTMGGAVAAPERSSLVQPAGM